MAFMSRVDYEMGEDGGRVLFHPSKGQSTVVELQLNRLRRKSKLFGLDVWVKFFGLEVWVQHFVLLFAHIVSVAVGVSLQLTRQATCYCC
jgi:hypothetical protein